MARFKRGIWAIFVLAMFAPFIARAQSSALTGVWELTDVAPQEVMNTSPTGVINQKLYFTDTGKVYTLKPDQTSIAGVTPADYRFDNNRLTLIVPGDAQQRHVAVMFSADGTMTVTPAGGARRTFRRVPGIATRLEPQSLQVVISNGKSEHARYDHTDDAGRPVHKRIKGIWEVIAIERLPEQQLPPYGFSNDLWKIDATGVTVFRREPAATETVPSALRDKLTSSGIGLGAPVGSKIEWAISFNEWGQLVLDSEYCRLILKRTAITAAEVASFPLKVVVVRIDRR